MSLVKVSKDYAVKLLGGKNVVPSGLVDLQKYFRHHDSIEFEREVLADGVIVARSVNFRHGSIVTTGRNEAEVVSNIKDSILTAFEIPSSYAKEAGIYRLGDTQERYAIA